MSVTKKSWYRQKKTFTLIKVGARSWAQTGHSSSKKEFTKEFTYFLDFKFRPVLRLTTLEFL